MALQRVCKTLLQNAFKGLLEDDQSFEIDGSIMDGRAEFKQILLRAEGLDRLIRGLPFQVESAKVDSVTIEVPWSTFWYPSSCAKVEIRGLQIDLVPRQQPAEPESEPAAAGTGGSPGRRALLQSEQHPQLEGQDTVDKELKKLLLETELSLLDTRVSLHSLPDRNGPCGHSPVTVSLVLGALTVGNLSEEGEDTPAPAVPEPEQAPGSGESGQEFQKRVSFEGLRIELSRACGSDAGSERNTTVIAHLRPHTPNTPDHLDIVYRKLAESDESRSRRRLATSPSKSLQVTGRFGELRAVLGNAHVADMMTMQGQLSAAAVSVARQVESLHSPHSSGATEGDAMSDQWAEAASDPPSTGASAVHVLVTSTASLLESGLGDEMFLSACGDDGFSEGGAASDPEQRASVLAASSVFKSMTAFDDEVASATTVCEVRLGCRHASLTLMLVKEDARDLAGGGVRWLDAPPAAVDPWMQPPSAIFDCETTTGHVHFAADNLALVMPGDGVEAEEPGIDPADWVAEMAMGVQRLRCDEYLSVALGGCEYGRATFSATNQAEASSSSAAMGFSSHMSQSVFSSTSFARNAILHLEQPSQGDVLSLKLLRPTHRSAAASGSVKKPARKGVLKFSPITFAIDTGLAGRLGTLLPPVDAATVSRSRTEPPDIAGSAAAENADPPALELSIECPKVIVRLHFMIAGTGTTPLSEYLELGPAVSDVGWRLMFRSWTATANAAGGMQLGGLICEQELRLGQNHGEVVVLGKIGGEISSRDQFGKVTEAAPRLRFEFVAPAWRGKVKQTFPVPGLGNIGAAHSGLLDLSRARMAARIDDAAAAINVAVSSVALGELKDEDYWRLKDLLANLRADEASIEQPEPNAARTGANARRRVSYAPCPEPEPEPEPPTAGNEETPVIDLFDKLAQRIPGIASVLSVEVQEFTVAVRGQYTQVESELSDEDDGEFDPYSDEPPAAVAVDYGYHMRAKEFRILNVACPCGSTDLSLLSVSATRLFLGDTAGHANRCLLETARNLAGPGTGQPVAKVALLCEQLVDDCDGTSHLVIQSSGLRLRPRWGARPPDGSVIPLDLVDCFKEHISSFFALSDTYQDSEDEVEDGTADHLVHSTEVSPLPRLLVRAEAVSLVLAAPPVKSPSRSGLLLHINSLDVDRGTATSVGTAATTAVAIRETALFLTDDHCRGKAKEERPSEAGLERYKTTYSQVMRVPAVAVSVQPGSRERVERIDFRFGHRDDCAGGLSGTNTDESPAAPEATATPPAISLHTCGDSFRTLNHLVQEILEARTTELDIRKTPSGSGHSVSRAVFADGQTALIAPAEETSAFEESSEAVQMDTVQWSSAPVIDDGYMERAGGVDGDGTAAELTHSSGSAGSWVLADEPPPQSVPLRRQPAAAAVARASVSLDSEAALPDVPDSDHATVMFEPQVLGNLMESYMQDDRHSRGSGAAVSAPNEPGAPRLRTPPVIDGEPRAQPCSPSAQPAPARMLTTYPEASSQISVYVSSVVWYIHDGNDWPRMSSRNLSHNQEAKAEPPERGSLHLEVWLSGLQVDYLMFASPEEGDIEWHLGVTLRDVNAIDRVVRSRFQNQSALAVQPTVPNRQRETHATVVALRVDSVHAVRQEIGVDITSLLKLKLKVEPIRVCVDGGMYRRCKKFFHDINPRPPVHPRPDDARFQLVEIGGIEITANYVSDFGGTQLVRDKPLALMPVNVYVEPEKNGVRVGDVTDIVCNLFVEEMLRRWPVEAVSWITSFQPVGALARVGGALADVPRQAIAEYRRSGDIAYAAYQLPTSTGKFIKTAVIEAADLANYLADVARTGLEYLDGQYVDPASKATQANPNLPVPAPQVGARRTSEAHTLSGACDPSSSRAPFVAGLREAGAAVQSGLAEATDAVVNTPLRQLENWQAGSMELPPVMTTMIRGVPVAILRPMIGATEAVSALSVGVRKSFADR